MYYFICALLSLLFIAAAVSHYVKISEKTASVIGKISLASGIAGVLLVAGAVALFFINLSKIELAADDKGWIVDTVSSYAATLAVFGVAIVAACLISSLLQPKFKILRVLLVLLSSILILISGLLFSFISANDKVTVSGYVKLISIGVSLFIQSGGCRDFRR